MKRKQKEVSQILFYNKKTKQKRYIILKFKKENKTKIVCQSLFLSYVTMYLNLKKKIKQILNTKYYFCLTIYLKRKQNKSSAFERLFLSDATI